MLVSYQWLQSFFNDALPSPDEIAEKLMFGAFEVESVEGRGDDHVLDIKVLPNRAHDCLSHRGIARELATLTGIQMSRDPLRAHLPEFARSETLKLSIDGARSPLYAAARITGVKIGPSPEWLRKRLESIGQRSINNIVDATNFVMFEIGTPLHAFDANKLEKDGVISIGVRPAAAEQIQLLGGGMYELTPEESVIANMHTNEALAIAGIKGGVAAEIGDDTASVVIEAAKFDPIFTRRASQRLRLRTDASKRFENEIADDLPLYGLKEVVKLITEIAGGTLEAVSLERARPPASAYRLGISLSEVNGLLGSQLNEADVGAVLNHLGFQHEKVDATARVLEEAKKYEGAPYKLGASVSREAPACFDCSSLTAWLYAEAGVSIPRVTVDQYLWGDEVSEDEMAAGDLVFSNSGQGKIWYESHEFVKGKQVPEGIDHVGLYMGGGLVLHASKSAGKVVAENLASSEAFRNTVAIRRVTRSGEERFVIGVPLERLDLRIPADLIEEIGRVFGYEHIGGVPLDEGVAIAIEPVHAVTEAVRIALSDIGFSEVYTYTLRAEGSVELANPFASDKKFLRRDLASGLRDALDKNEPYLPLLRQDVIRIFEVGIVFPEAGREEVHVGVAARGGKKSEMLQATALSAAEQALKAIGIDAAVNEGVIECDVAPYAESFKKNAYPPAPRLPALQYTPLSPYPFIRRDIALWVQEFVREEELLETIREAAGELLVNSSLFDEFKKDGRVSYAFHLIFQSMEKTLTDDEINLIMEKVHAAALARGWEVR